MRTAGFEAPGPGYWELDRSHYDSGATPISAKIMGEATLAAYRKLFADRGMPADGIEMQTVNGFLYSRIRPLVGSDRSPSKPPPDWVVRVLVRLHPEFRRREKRAAAALSGLDFRTSVDRWRAEIRPRLIARNRELQEVAREQLDDAALSQHIAELLAHLRATYEEHHRLHGDDLGPIGRLVVTCRPWDIGAEEVLEALAGASPSTTEPLEQLVAIREELDAAGVTPASLEEVRDVSRQAAALLDGYLARHGAVLFSSYDIDSPTLAERPEVVLQTILQARRPGERIDDARAVASTLRERVPQADRAEFDVRLDEAREAMDMRDDNGPITVEWPAGLVRLGLLEAGRRLAAVGRIADPQHVFELGGDEVVAMVGGGPGPSIDEVTARAADRAAARLLDPPASLGPESPPPDLSLLPPAMGEMMDMVMSVVGALGAYGADDHGSMRGTGIGEEVFTGVARTAATADEAIADLQPGEILVTRATSPAFNLVLTMAGGLITADGGPMSHAAVLSRELGLPAVIGVADCLDHISSGDRVEIDAANGTVRLLS